MGGSNFTLDLLTGAVVFAWPAILVLIVVAAVDILLNPSVAHAPEMEHDPNQEELEELKAKVKEDLAEVDEMIRAAEGGN